ncbi:MAG: hypothetical protein KGJ07_10115, partial [Patescibacteria group bacterium]|nr:hypothetical protein [Patescibacteria group bacterium]
IRNLIGDTDGVYAVMGPSADFTGVQNNDKPGAGEIGVLTLIRKQGKRYTIYDGSVLTTAVKDGDKWSTTSTTLRQREHNDIFAISEPFDKAIIANLGVLKLDGGQDKETAPIVIKATIPAGKTVELKDLAQAVTGDDSDIRLPRGSMFVMTRSDGVVDFSVKRNVICAMPSELGDKWVDDFKDAGKGYTAWQEEFAVPGDKTYIGAGTFDTDLPYSRNGHVHGVNAESGGHLVSITAGNSPVEMAIVMYPARKSAYTSTTGQRVN